VGQTLLLLIGVGIGTLLVGGGSPGSSCTIASRARRARMGADPAAGRPAYVIGFAFIGLFEYRGAAPERASRLGLARARGCPRSAPTRVSS